MSKAAEKQVYDQHENSPADVGYRKFLERLFIPLSKRLNNKSTGLDFGCGPGPTLSLMFTEAGFDIKTYDPFYAPDNSVLKLQYDFITATEVVEHLHKPRIDLDRLWAYLKPSGLLGIMTKRVIDQPAFANWHYKNDPTHVCFFSMVTFQWIADNWGANLEILDNDVVIFTKPK